MKQYLAILLAAATGSACPTTLSCSDASSCYAFCVDITDWSSCSDSVVVGCSSVFGTSTASNYNSLTNCTNGLHDTLYLIPDTMAALPYGWTGFGESDVDCGGAACSPCKLGKKCRENSDCFGELRCDSGNVCVASVESEADAQEIPYHAIAWPFLGFSAFVGVFLQIYLERREKLFMKEKKQREQLQEQTTQLELRKKNTYHKKNLRGYSNSYIPSVPSEEFAGSGKESLEHILRDNERSKAFYAFSKSKFAHENILFWNAINGYDAKWAATVVDRSNIDKLGNQIIEDFVLESGKFEVNIAHTVRLDLLAVRERALQAPDETHVYGKDTFQTAKMEIFSLMNTNFYADFITFEAEQNGSIEVV